MGSVAILLIEFGRDEGRGVSNSAITDAVNNPIRVIRQSGGTTKYIGKDAKVVLSQNGRVITACGKDKCGN